MKALRFSLLTILPAAACIVLGASASSPTLTGKVSGPGERPLAGVSVTVKGTSRSAASGADGRYSITAGRGEVVVFTFAGFQEQEHTVAGPVLDVKMEPEVQVEELLIMECVKHSAYTGEAAAPQRTRSMVSADMAYAPDFNNADAETYAAIRENRFTNVSKDPLSTFALEVDGAAYSNVRRMINSGRMPEPDAVRVEEMVNYFSYDYDRPTGGDPLKIGYEVATCPWNAEHKLVRIGIKAREIPSDNLPAANFVFLVDVSGSMWSANRLPLVKQSLKLLTNNLRDGDRVAIVTYSGSAGEALPSTPGSDKQKIREALEALEAGGSTAGGAGIKLAYNIARRNFIPGGNNRIILCTDGDFNVGVSSAEGLESLIEKERKSGVFLTVLGYGMGNYKDENLQTLAEKGNGNYAYIDNLQEANKVLVNEFGGTMYTVAKDAKLQIEFNPAHVQAFRLVGYESRLLEHEDFNDDTKDAGEIGAGHSVTALYEIVPVGAKSSVGSIDPLRYQNNPVSAKIPRNSSKELMTIKLRYKAPDGDKSRLTEMAVVENGRQPSEDFRFASAVAMFGQLLRDSDFKGDATYDTVIAQARLGLGDDPHGYRREFIRLAETVKGMAK